MSENDDEYEKVCSHPECYEFPKGLIPRLRRFVSDIEKTVNQEQFDILYDEMIKEGYSVEELNNVIECCVGYLPYECMLPLEESGEMEGEESGETERDEPSKFGSVKSGEEKLRGFLERLRSNISYKLDIVLKPRKLQVSGDSIVVTVPKELDVVYPRGSDVLTVWNKDEKSLFFFGVGSVMSDENMMKVVDEWRSDWVCFRTVLGRDSINALVVPKQFLGYFKKDKVNLFWNVEDNVLRVESNLSFQEWVELEEKRAKERITTELSVRDASSGVKFETVSLNIGRCYNCGKIGGIRFWYEDVNSKGVPLCPNCYSGFEQWENMVRRETEAKESSAFLGLGTLIYGELKKRFGKKEEKGEVEPRI